MYSKIIIDNLNAEVKKLNYLNKDLSKQVKKLKSNDAVLQTLEAPVVIVNSLGFITYINNALCDLIDLKPEDLLGKHCIPVVMEYFKNNQDTLKLLMEKIQGTFEKGFFGESFKIWIKDKCYQVQRAQNQKRNIAAIFYDITEEENKRISIEKELELQKDSLEYELIKELLEKELFEYLHKTPVKELRKALSVESGFFIEFIEQLGFERFALVLNDESVYRNKVYTAIGYTDDFIKAFDSMNVDLDFLIKDHENIIEIKNEEELRNNKVLFPYVEKNKLISQVKYPFYIVGLVDNYVVYGIAIWAGDNGMYNAKKDVSFLKRITGILSLSIKEEIQAKREAIIRKDTLHRVKNLLAQLTSLVVLKKQDIEKKEKDEVVISTLNDFLNYVISKTNVITEMLTWSYTSEVFRTNKYYVLVSDYIRKLGSNLCGLYQNCRTEIQYEIDNEIYLGEELLLPIGLIFNEAVTNSLKYASSNNDQPKINIKFSKNNDTNVVSMRIKDNGPGFPENFKEKSSLGVILIVSLTEQIQGEIKIENDNGALIEVVFPIN